MNMLHDLGRAYVLESWPFFFTHLLLLTFSLLGTVRRLWVSSKNSKLTPSNEFEYPPLKSYADSILVLAQKGTAKDRATIRSDVDDICGYNTGRSDFFSYAFVGVGLLGTLYNLFTLGPNAWSGLLEKGNATVLVGGGFAVSIAGMTLSLLNTLLDETITTPYETNSARGVTDTIYISAVNATPLSTGQTIEQLSATLVEQIHDTMEMAMSKMDAATISHTMAITKATESWNKELKQLTDHVATTTTDGLGKLGAIVTRIDESTGALHQSISRSMDAVQQTTTILESYRDISSLINKVNEVSTNLTREVAESVKNIPVELQSVVNQIASKANDELANRMDGILSDQASRFVGPLEEFTKTAKNLPSELGVSAGKWSNSIDSTAGRIDSAASNLTGALVPMSQKIAASAAAMENASQNIASIKTPIDNLVLSVQNANKQELLTLKKSIDALGPILESGNAATLDTLEKLITLLEKSAERQAPKQAYTPPPIQATMGQRSMPTQKAPLPPPQKTEIVQASEQSLWGRWFGSKNK